MMVLFKNGWAFHSYVFMRPPTIHCGKFIVELRLKPAFRTRSILDQEIAVLMLAAGTLWERTAINSLELEELSDTVDSPQLIKHRRSIR